MQFADIFYKQILQHGGWNHPPDAIKPLIESSQVAFSKINRILKAISPLRDKNNPFWPALTLSKFVITPDFNICNKWNNFYPLIY